MYEYLNGYFMADGYMREKDKESFSKCTAETKDKEFAEILASKYSDDDVKERIRTVRTGTECLMYTVKFRNEISNYIRNCFGSYKDYREYFRSLSAEGKHEFMKGFCDGDGSICIYANHPDSCRVVLYAAEDYAEDIIKEYLTEFSIKFGYSIDSRGHLIKVFSVGSKESLVKIFNYWYGEVLLNRKYEVIHNFVSKLKWFKIVTPTGINYSVNRKCAQRLTGYSIQALSEMYRKIYKIMKPYYIEPIDFIEVLNNKDKILYE